jgi:DNA-binding NtrC family response regulator
VTAQAETRTSASVETVLVLDDDVLVRLPIAQYLRDCGYRVLEAASADEAKIILEKPEVRVDVVLSDIDMPGPMNGFGFATWARSVRPGLQIVLAGTPQRAANVAAELCDEGPMLTRPYAPQLVLDHIKRLLATRGEERNAR